MKTATAILAAVAAVAGPAQAVMVEVTVTGTVVFNGIGDPPLGDAMPGDPALLTFLVDSDNFVDGIPGDTRGYEIDQASFVLTIGPAMVGLAAPFPPGETPYFTLVDGFPVSDGFFVSTSPFSPGGVPLEQEPFEANVDLGYVGGTLDSLDILDALGIYDFDGLTMFGFNLWSIFPDNVVMELDFEQMTISAVVSVPAAVDIKPGSCPNPFNRRSRGKLPVAVLGTADFDVADIDVDTVEVSRADGVGGSVAPLRTGSGDVGTPFEGEPCDCHEMGGDGWDDLTLKFRSREVVAALELGTLMGGDFVELTVSGSLLDGTP
ncbi:MAG: hypothetical protein ACYTAQ_11415, partial [Planctomycetota bacterium]